MQVLNLFLFLRAVLPFLMGGLLIASALSYRALLMLFLDKIISFYQEDTA